MNTHTHFTHAQAIQFGVDYRDHGGRTPLMYTVLGNQPRMCEVLLGLGAAVNAKDTSGLTPLLWATFQAKPLIIRVLLRSVRGASNMLHGVELSWWG